MATYPIVTTGTQDTSTTGGMTNSAGKQVCRAQLDWTRTETATDVTYSVSVYIYCTRYGYKTNSSLSSSVTDGTTPHTTSNGSCSLSSGGRAKLGGAYTYTVTKTQSVQNRTFDFSVTSGGRTVSGTSSGSWADEVSALETYAVRYASNGGSGYLMPQTKYKGTALTLRAGGIARLGYTLTGWNTKANGNGTSYALGGSYTTDANATMYAQWRQDYIKPTIKNLKAYRVASASDTTQDDEGTTIFYSFDYTGGSTNGTTYIAPTCVIKVDGTQKSSTTLSASGSVATTVTGTYTIDTTHTLSVQLYDSNDTTGITVSVSVPAAVYPIDLIAETNGTYMGIMTPAVSGQDLTVPELSVQDDIRVKGDIYAGCANNFTGGIPVNPIVKQVAANGTTTISSQNARYTLTLIGGASTYRGMYLVAGYNTSVETKAISSVASGVVSTSGANVVINNNENYAMIVVATVYVGSVTMS